MKKKIVTVIIGCILLAALMFAEYRYIMVNISPSLDDKGNIYLEIFGQVDEYCIKE